MSNFGKDVQWIQICDAARDGNFYITGLIAAQGGFFAVDLVRFWQNEEDHILELSTDLVFIAELAQAFRAVAKEDLAIELAGIAKTKS